mmetsp:Transcript_19569/g.17314  ORF Transcript_19569/g.17314 Transcript_19569/m.17314 type:complete len:142 (+) Transcript_19569:307-732(+)
MMDDEGFVKITGRIKDLIITAGGEKIAPLIIEESLKKICPIINKVKIIRDVKKYLSALITLKTEVNNLQGINIPTKELTVDVINFLKNELGVTEITTTDEAIRSVKIVRYIEEMIQRYNKNAVSRAHHIRKYTILVTDLSI